jgi:hypothetical protein
MLLVLSYYVNVSYEKPTRNDQVTGKSIFEQEILKIEESRRLLESYPTDDDSILTLETVRKISRRTLPKKGKAVDQVTIILKTKEDINLSPCKIVKRKDLKTGAQNLYECAPREEQINNFRNLECKTTHRRVIVKVDRPTESFASRIFPDGCELRFRKSKKNCNKLKFSNNMDC